MNSRGAVDVRDLAAEAARHRPAERTVLRAAAVELRQRGLQPRDIASALGLTERATRALLEGAR